MLSACDTVAIIVVRDMSRARSFYEGQLGLRYVGDVAGGAALVLQANAHLLWLSIEPDSTPNPDVIAMSWRVENIVETINALATRGIEFDDLAGELRRRFETNDTSAIPDADGLLDELLADFDDGDPRIWQLPESSVKMAWFKDPDGNRLSLVEWAAPL